MNSAEPRQDPPSTPEGAGWRVFEYLIDLHIEDASAVERMTSPQRAVLALNLVRQEVGSGGFEGYFAWTGGTSVDLALDAFQDIAPAMGLLLREAVDLRDAGGAAEFEALDRRFNLAEEEADVDALVDAFVAEHQDAFYTREG